MAPRLDELYAKRFAEAGATASVVGIVLAGELVYVGAFGARDIESNTPVDADTVFRIGSLTKSFAATAILKLRDEGRLELDVPAVRYYPEIAQLQGAPADSPPITIRHLLTMTSGLPYDDVWGPVSFGYDERQFASFLAAGVPLASAPGERAAYSNLGYALLGKIIERVSGLGFRDYVTANILVPLGMTSSSWAGVEGRLAVGYYKRAQVLLPEPHPNDGEFAPAGGLYSTLSDYSRYLGFQLSAYAARDAPEAAPLRRSTLREMHRGQAWIRWGEGVPVVSRDEKGGTTALLATNYGFGWVNNTSCAYEGIVQHGGYEPGYYSYVRFLPRDDLGIVVFSATAAIGDRKTFEAALSLLKEAGVLTPRSQVAPALKRASASVNELLGKWDDALARVTFDPDSLRYSFFATIREDLAKLARSHGQCRPDGELLASSPTQAVWNLSCDRGAIRFNVSLSPAREPLIQMLTWKEAEGPEALGASIPGGVICAE